MEKKKKKKFVVQICRIAISTILPLHEDHVLLDAFLKHRDGFLPEGRRSRHERFHALEVTRRHSLVIRHHLHHRRHHVHLRRPMILQYFYQFVLRELRHAHQLTAHSRERERCGIYRVSHLRPATRITSTILELGRNARSKSRAVSRGTSCDDHNFFSKWRRLRDFKVTFSSLNRNPYFLLRIWILHKYIKK